MEESSSASTGRDRDTAEVLIRIHAVLALNQHATVRVGFCWWRNLSRGFDDTDDGILHHEIFLVVGGV